MMLNWNNPLSHRPCRRRQNHKPLICLEQISKSYATDAGTFHALRDVDLEIQAGEFVAIVGKSGSGKSTLINMITGIDRPTTGKIMVAETNVHGLDEQETAIWRGKTIGVIFQFFQLLPTLTAVENIMLAMDYGGTIPLRQRPRRAQDLLDLVGMTAHAHKLPNELSGGQLQSVAIARALANDPPILAADEPTGNLDSASADMVWRLFGDLVGGGKTILMVTHDVDLAQRTQRQIVMADGRIVDGRHRQSKHDVGRTPVPPGMGLNRAICNTV